MAGFSVDIVGGPALVSGMAALSDTRELTVANGIAARTVAAKARSLAPHDSGALAGSIGEQSTTDGWQAGSNSPYARWFHVPFLSDGNVRYAAKISSRGRSYGQRIPYNPFMTSAVVATEAALVKTYVDGVGNMIDRALSGVPRG